MTKGEKSDFENVSVLGAMGPTEALAKLRELEEHDLANQIEAALDPTSTEIDAFGNINLWSWGRRKPWQHTSHAFGYIEPTSTRRRKPVPLVPASSVTPTSSLLNKCVKITLDGLRVADYPGAGTHFVLFDFYGQNQTPSKLEHLHFNTAYRAYEGEEVAVVGYPIFVGLNVGHEGVAFKCLTVNVKNQNDEALLAFLESDAFQTGLKLVSTIQPAIPLLSETAWGMTKAIASRNRNVPVQNFHLGLDFSTVPTRARLAEGSYIAVQAPSSEWNWGDWVYDKKSGRVLDAGSRTQLPPYNYIVFGLSRFDED